MKKICPWKFNLEYGGTFTNLFMHVSSQNMFSTMIADHDLVKKSFGPMIADHDLVKKR